MWKNFQSGLALKKTQENCGKWVTGRDEKGERRVNAKGRKMRASWSDELIHNDIHGHQRKTLKTNTTINLHQFS